MEHSPLNELIELARKEYPGADFGFLVNSIYGEALTQSEKQNFLKFIDVARTLQIENPIFEAIYQQLLHLYVLNGSRLDVLKTIERRLRGLLDGQGGLLLISGLSGIGKTSMIIGVPGTNPKICGQNSLLSAVPNRRVHPMHYGRM